MDATISDISRIKTGTPEEKRRLLKHFLSSRSPGGIQLAVEALGDADWTVRRYASESLARLGPSVLEYLGKVLSSGDENQRYWAVQALVGVGRDAVPLLLKILARGNKSMRVHASRALGEIRDPVSLPHLVEALADPVWQVRFHCYEGLVAFGDRALPELKRGIDSENEDRAYWSAKALGKLGESSRDVLLEALREGNRRLRFVIAAALGETGDQRVIRVLINSTKDRSWIVRRRASDALAEIGPSAIPLLIEAIQDEDPNLIWILAALGKMGEPGISALVEVLRMRGEAAAWNWKEALVELGSVSAPLFLRLAARDDQDLRFFAVSCLGELPGEPKVDRALLDALKDPCWSIRKVASECLSQRGVSILDALSEAMELGNEDLRYWVCVVFRKMGEPGVDKLIEALQDSNTNVAYFAASALAEVRHPRVIRPLIRALASGSWPVRNAASTSLSLQGDLAVEKLVHACEDEHEDVSFWVAKTLRRIGRGGLPVMLRMLRKGTDEQRYLSAKALGILKDPESVEVLVEGLKDGHEWVRLYAAIALGEIQDPRAIQPLLQVLADPAFRVHPRIVEVFRSFGDRIIPRLLDLSDQGETHARANAFRVLGALGSEEAFERIEAVASDEASDPDLRLASVQALGNFSESERAISLLGSVAINEGTGTLRSRAILALGEIENDLAIPLMLKAMASSESRDDVTRVENILKGRGATIIPNLVETLGHRDVAVRKAGAEILETFGAEIRPYLQTASMENDPNVRFWANKLLKKLGEKSLRA